MMNLEESIKRRINSILHEVRRRGFKTVVFLNEVIGQNPSNFVYVSGPWGLGEEHGSIIFDIDGGSTVVLPHWGAKKMEESNRYDKVIAIKQEKSHHIMGVKEALASVDKNKICFDLSTMSSQLAYHMSKELGLNLVPGKDISDYVFKLRAIKDDFEIQEIQKAIQITEEAVLELIQASRPGKHTWKLKKKLDAAMIEKGAMGFSFDSSIGFSSGPRGSYRCIKHGDVLLTDVGCRVATGYCSDMGRTWPTTLDAEIKDYLERVLAAHSESLKKIKTGMSGNDVLKMASEINVEYGFEPLIRCGHQIGLDVHDYTMPFAPSFGPIETDNQPLKPGMILTFEPQHLDTKLDMRSHIEDIILIKESKSILLNELPWDPTW